jgi:hypothetical protein
MSAHVKGFGCRSRAFDCRDDADADGLLTPAENEGMIHVVEQHLGRRRAGGKTGE